MADEIDTSALDTFLAGPMEALPPPPKTGFSTIDTSILDRFLGPQESLSSSKEQADALKLVADSILPTGGDLGAGAGAMGAANLVSNALPWYLRLPAKGIMSGLGAYAGRPTGEYVQDVGTELVSGTPENIPSIPLPERDLAGAMIEGPMNLMMGSAMSKLGSKQVGQETINDAKNKFVNAVGAASKDLVSKSYDNVANEMVPDITQSVMTAMEAGVFKGATGSKAQGIIEANTRKLIKGADGEKGLEEQVGELLLRKSGEQKIDSSVIREYLDQKVQEPGGLFEYIGRNYKDPTSQEAADKAIVAFVDRFKDLDNPLNDLVDLNGLKRSYQRLVNYNENLAPYDKIQNTVHRKIAQTIRESIEELSGGDGLVKDLNNKLGALYDVEDMVSGATAKSSIIRPISAASQFSDLYSSVPGGLALGSVSATGAIHAGASPAWAGTMFAAGAAPAIYHTISKHMRSPSGLIKRGNAQDKLGKISRSIGDWYENKDMFEQILLDVTKTAGTASIVRNALEGDSGDWAAKQVHKLTQDFPELETLFEVPTGIFAGLKSYFEPYIADAQERVEYADRLTTKELSKPFLERDSIALSKKLTALNRDGSVIDAPVSKRVQKQAPDTVEGVTQDGEALANEEAPLTKGVVTGLADGVKVNRSSYSY